MRTASTRTTTFQWRLSGRRWHDGGADGGTVDDDGTATERMTAVWAMLVEMVAVECSRLDPLVSFQTGECCPTSRASLGASNPEGIGGAKISFLFNFE
jgi:hypothetical protein